MKRMRIVILGIIAVLATGLIATSCISDDFTTSPTDLLSFSTDTVSFDTVFTDQGTPTARLLVFNRAKKSINISEIRFKSEDSHFQLNVDGVSGKVFHDVEIRGRDSIYVFIECFPPANADKHPYLVADRLEFVTNGVRQEVEVEAYGQNVVRLKNHRIASDTRFTADLPYVVYDSLVVEKGAKLTIDPGAQLLFHDKGSLIVHGQIEAVGEAGKMIQMRPDRLDNVLPGISYDILAGQWKGVRISADSYDNRLEYVDMRSTVSGLCVDSCGNSERLKLLLRNSWLHNSQGSVLTSSHAKVDAYGVCFSEAADAVVSLKGGSHEFVQCTIANYYLFSVISEPLLCLYNLVPDAEGNYGPLMKASFENCIIYGLASDLNIGDLTDTDVYIRNVLFKSEGTDDDHFINCVWDSDPLFYTVRSDYYFNYRLQPESPAIGAGNAAFITPLCQYDMDGYNRLAEGNPALGAYVFIPPKEE